MQCVCSAATSVSIVQKTRVKGKEHQIACHGDMAFATSSMKAPHPQQGPCCLLSGTESALLSQRTAGVSPLSI